MRAEGLHLGASAVVVVAIGSLLGIAPALAQPENDNFASATIVPAVPFTDITTNAGATTEPSEPDPSCDPNPLYPLDRNTQSTIWYRFTPAQSETLMADTFGTYSPTTIAVYRGSQLSQLTEVACDRSGGSGGLDWQSNSWLWFQAVVGQTYYVQIGERGGASGTIEFHLGPPGSISGTVTGLGGQTLGGQCVSAFSSRSVAVLLDVTDEFGHYTLAPLTSDYRIRFGSRWCDDYGNEWYDDKGSFESADVITVAHAVTGVDAVLPVPLPPPAPDLAILNLSVYPAPRDHDPDWIFTAGYAHRVDADIANLNGVDPEAAALHVSGCTISDWQCRTIAFQSLNAPAGRSVHVSVPWSSAGMVGDVLIIAELLTCQDTDWSNNNAQAHYSVLIPQTGYGVTLFSRERWIVRFSCS